MDATTAPTQTASTADTAGGGRPLSPKAAKAKKAQAPKAPRINGAVDPEARDRAADHWARELQGEQRQEQAQEAELEAPVPALEARPLEDTKRDLRSVIRCLGLGFELVRVKKLGAEPRLDRTDAVAEKLAEGIGPRVSPTWDRRLFWVAMAADAGASVLEDLVKAAAKELAK